jgi:tRNA_anti-like
MAIIACRECAHEVSSQAAACPNCGAPIAALPTKPKRRTKRGLLTILSALALLCLIAAALRYLPSNQLSTLLGQFSRKAERTAPAEHSALVEPLGTPIQPVLDTQSSPRASAAGPRPVYQISAEQLFQAYSANAVATQSRIGNSRIRITGTVAEIDEDSSGHPVVRLSTSHDDSAQMLLNDDQKAAAAELVKGETVDVQCERIQRDSTQRAIATPQGSGCSLESMDAASTQAYLAVFLPNEKGVAPLYIVGPMSKAVCLSRGDSISAQLGEARRDPIVSKNCAATAHESIPSEGCRLSASMTALPDMPAAHVWRYDCAERPTAPRRATDKATAQKKSTHGSAVANVATDTVIEPPAEADAAFSTAVETTVAAPVSEKPSSSASSPSGTSGAVAEVSNVANAPAPALDQAPAANPVVAATSAIPADLVTVKAADPGAADHIAAYCNRVTASASDQAAVAAGCRHEEIAAWTRLVLNNEFPTLDETTRRKCSESPFPDSYVAKESCAKYVLNVNR